MKRESYIFSDKFWTRALAIWGHNLAITLAFYGVLFIIALLISL